MTKVGTLPSQLLWNVEPAQPSLVARQHAVQFPVFGNHSPSIFVKSDGSFDNIWESKSWTKFNVEQCSTYEMQD